MSMKITVTQLRTAIREVLKEIHDEAPDTLLMDDAPETERDPIDTIWDDWSVDTVLMDDPNTEVNPTPDTEFSPKTMRSF